jgi:hypothetical protein
MKFYSNLKNPTDLFETCFYLINKFESKSIDDEIEYRTLLKNSLIKNLENFKNVYADELKYFLEIVIENISTYSYESVRHIEKQLFEL